MIEHLVTHLADGRNTGQAVSLAFMVLLLYQFIIYARLDKSHSLLLIFPILIVIEGIIFYSYILVTAQPPGEFFTTLSWLLRFQVVTYSFFFMKYQNRKKRIEKRLNDE